jgi:hypothetical protein
LSMKILRGERSISVFSERFVRAALCALAALCVMQGNPASLAARTPPADSQASPSTNGVGGLRLTLVRVETTLPDGSKIVRLVPRYVSDGTKVPSDPATPQACVVVDGAIPMPANTRGLGAGLGSLPTGTGATPVGSADAAALRGGGHEARIGSAAGASTTSITSVRSTTGTSAGVAAGATPSNAMAASSTRGPGTAALGGGDSSKRTSAWAVDRAGVASFNASIAAPGNIAARDLGNGSDAAVSWSDLSANEAEFVVQRQRYVNATWVDGATLHVGATRCGTTDSPGPGTFRYRAAAANSSGISAYSDWAAVTVVGTAPNAPSSFTIQTSAGNSLALLAWVDNSTTEAGFVVQRQQDLGAGVFGPTTELTTGPDQQQYTDAAGAGTWRYRVLASNEWGASLPTPWVPASLMASSQPGAGQPPNAPSNLTATAPGNRRAMVSWTDNSGNETGFRLERTPAFAAGFVSVGADVTNYLDACGVGTFTYRVRAENADGQSGFTPWGSVQVPEIPPAAPTGLAAADAGNERDVTLTWTDNADNETGFRVERQAQGAVYGTWGATTTLTAAANATVLTDSPGAGTYQYRLAATNGAGESAATGWVRVTVSDGWTHFVPSADTRIVYVSSSGNDANSGLSQDAPKQTINAARALLRSGYPDWIVFKCGDTFSQTPWEIGGYGGRSPSERQVWSSYGTGERPVFIPVGADDGIHFNWSPSYVAVVGLHVKAVPTGGGSGISFIAGSRAISDVLIEDCFVEGFKDNMNIQGGIGGANLIRNLAIRRCVVVNAYPPGTAHSQGAYINAIDGIIIEDCLFDHNGWKNIDRSDATIFNHNLYIGTGNTGNAMIRNNIIARASSHGLQLRCGGTIEGNLFVLNPIACQLGGGDPAANTHTNGVSGLIAGNVIVEGTDIDVNNRRGWGIIANDIGMSGAIISGNVISTNRTGGGNAVGMAFEANRYGNGVGYNHLDIKNNIIWGWNAGVSFASAATTPPSPSTFCTIAGNSFHDNDIQIPVSAVNVVTVGFASSPAAVSFGNNTYWSGLPDTQQLRYNNTSMGLAQWASATGDAGSSVRQAAYADTSRSVGSYSQSVGGLATTEDFLANARQQRRGAWRSEYSAKVVGAYLRGGFADVP